jgi:hypothetical protein
VTPFFTQAATADQVFDAWDAATGQENFIQ